MSKKSDKDWQEVIANDVEQLENANAEIDDEEQAASTEQAEIDMDEEDEEETGERGGLGGVLEHPSYKALEGKLTEMEMKAHENWDKAMRISAELENVRRRAKLDVENAHKFGNESFVCELLPIVDSLEQALHLEDGQEVASPQLREGTELTLKLVLDTFAKFKIVPIDPEGQLFDPQLHEAMSIQDSPEHASGTVIKVYQKGYSLHGRVIRPARVIVSKNK